MNEKIYVSHLLAQRLSFELAPPLIVVLQILFLSFGLGLILYAWRRYPAVWGRPAFFFGLAFVAIYQIPAIIYGGHLYIGLPDLLGLFFVINFMPITIGLWLLISSRYYPYSGECNSLRLEQLTTENFKKLLFLLSGLTVLVFGVFFYFIPWKCTGLWSMLFDPESTLLAREISMKLNNNHLVNRLYGFYVNALGPTLCFIGLYFASKCFKERKFLNCLYAVVLAFIAIALVLVAGIKGLLVSMGIFLLAAVFSSTEGSHGRFAAVVVCAVFFGMSLLAFEAARYRVQLSTGPSYDFAGCAITLGSCQSSAELVRSAAVREEGGLGLNRDKLDEFGEQLKKSCNNKTFNIDTRSQSAKSLTQTTSTQNSAIVTEPEMVKKNSLDFWIQITPNFWNRITPLAVRLFQIPLQVATWHFIFVAQHPSPGWNAISVVGRISGEKSNLAEKVYQEYGSVYSLGDRTSTSTAPTSFAFSYVAGIGFKGFVFSLVLLIGLDVFTGAVVRKLQSPLKFAAYGLSAATAINLISSDFFTVLISHGGVLGLVLVYCLEKFMPGATNPDN